MKKLCLLLVIAVLTGVFTSVTSVSASVAVTAAKPYDAEAVVDMSGNTHASAYYGLWSNAVDVDGQTRDFCLYTPQGYFPWNRLVLVFVPNGMSAEDFAVASEWMTVSEEGSAAVAFLQPAGLEWGNLEEETPYVNAVINYLANYNIDFIKYASDGMYAVGYGEGATIGQEFVLSHPAWFAGVVMLGAEAADEAFITETSGEPCFVFAESRAQTIEGYENVDCVVPYWVIQDGTENTALVEYLKKVNNTIDEGLRNDYAEVYNQRYLASDGDRNSQAISRVWVSDIEGAVESYKDYELTSVIWNDFLSPICRYLGQPMGALRGYYTMESIGAKVFTETMEHTKFEEPIERLWAVYAPSSYDGSKPMPVVLAIHGFTGTYDMFAHNTEWWRVAEERGFIVVFAQATPNDNSNCGTARWRGGYKAFNYTGTETEADANAEIAYFKRLLESVRENYNVDESRIYCTGHSNGGSMTYVLSEALPGVFAATAQVGSTTREFETLEDMPAQSVKMPYLNVECEYDSNTDPSNTKSNLYWEFVYRLKRNGHKNPLNPLFTQAYSGLFTNRSYHNAQGIPSVQFALYDESCHAYMPDISYYVWDEFFINFSRGDDGTSYYRGVEIE